MFFVVAVVVVVVVVRFFCVVVLDACCALCAAVMYGQIILASIQFCQSFLFQTTPFLHPRICQSSRASQIPPTHPFFYCPPHFSISKNGVFIPEIRRYLRIFDRFLLVKRVKYQPILKWFSFSDSSSGKLFYNIAAQSLSRHKLRCMKIIMETFSG